MPTQDQEHVFATTLPVKIPSIAPVAEHPTSPSLFLVSYVFLFLLALYATHSVYIKVDLDVPCSLVTKKPWHGTLYLGSRLLEASCVLRGNRIRVSIAATEQMVQEQASKIYKYKYFNDYY